MPVTVTDDYFHRAPFAGARPGELFAALTCLVCGHRSVTFAAFRAHRAGPECHGATTASHAEGLGPAWQRGNLNQLDRDALEALKALASLVPDPDPIDTALLLEETLT